MKMFAILRFLAQLFVHVIVTKTTIYCIVGVVPVVTTTEATAAATITTTASTATTDTSNVVKSFITRQLCEVVQAAHNDAKLITQPTKL